MMRKKRYTPRQYITAGLLILLLLWLMFLLWGIFRKEEVARHRAEETKRQLVALSAREDTLRKNIAELNTERGQEASIRETYGVARAGEEVIIVVPAEDGDIVPKESLWTKIRIWFGF